MSTVANIQLPAQDIFIRQTQTLVSDLSDVSFTVILIFFCPGTDLGDGTVNRHEILHDGTYGPGRCFSPLGIPWGGIPMGFPGSKILAL